MQVVENMVAVPQPLIVHKPVQQAVKVEIALPVVVWNTWRADFGDNRRHPAGRRKHRGANPANNRRDPCMLSDFTTPPVFVENVQPASVAAFVEDRAHIFFVCEDDVVET